MDNFIIYWRSGEMETVNGDGFRDAFRKAGNGGGSITAVDFYEEGTVPNYEYVKGQGWVLKKK